MLGLNTHQDSHVYSFESTLFYILLQEIEQRIQWIHQAIRTRSEASSVVLVLAKKFFGSCTRSGRQTWTQFISCKLPFSLIYFSMQKWHFHFLLLAAKPIQQIDRLSCFWNGWRGKESCLRHRFAMLSLISNVKLLQPWMRFTRQQILRHLNSKSMSGLERHAACPYTGSKK